MYSEFLVGGLPPYVTPSTLTHAREEAHLTTGARGLLSVEVKAQG
jgi:hypothetical protein